MHGGELGFLKFIKGKIIPIQGDLVIEKLGISEEDRELIREEV